MSCPIASWRLREVALAGRLPLDERAMLRTHLRQPCDECLDFLETAQGAALLNHVAGPAAVLTEPEATAMFGRAIERARQAHDVGAGADGFPADGRTSAILLEKANAALRGTAPPSETDVPVLSRTGAMDQLRGILLERIAPSPINVLFLGETGVGEGSPRSRAPPAFPARRRTLRRPELRRARRIPPRSGALRLRAGRLHRSGRGQAGPHRLGERRNPLPGRGSARCRLPSRQSCSGCSRSVRFEGWGA